MTQKHSSSTSHSTSSKSSDGNTAVGAEDGHTPDKATAPEIAPGSGITHPTRSLADGEPQPIRTEKTQKGWWAQGTDPKLQYVRDVYWETREDAVAAAEEAYGGKIDWQESEDGVATYGGMGSQRVVTLTEVDVDTERALRKHPKAQKAKTDAKS